MKANAINRTLMCMLAVVLGVMIFSHTALAAAGRVEFDDRLIKGQIAKAGGVFLFDRKLSETPSLVKRRYRLRARIIRTVYEDVRVEIRDY